MLIYPNEQHRPDLLYEWRYLRPVLIERTPIECEQLRKRKSMVQQGYGCLLYLAY